MFGRYRMKIHFAYRTFAWESEARGKAHVHCVIVGFANYDSEAKIIYEPSAGHQTVMQATNIGPYLLEGPDRAVTNRSEPICDVPKMLWGNKPTDGGHFILSPEDRAYMLEHEPFAEKYIRPFMGGGDFINGDKRYCLWLKDASPSELRKLPLVMERVEAVRQTRLSSKAASTRKYAEYSTLFRQISQPNSDYLAVPEVSSVNRKYIPIAFVGENTICSNTVQFVPGATLWHFGILTSAMHMAWVRTVSGRLKSDFRYSSSIVYNNFPWPDHISDSVENAARAVLAARAMFPDATLADLYDPSAMPPALTKAHGDLNRSVDKCYRSEPFHDDHERMSLLFNLYDKLASLFAGSDIKTKRKPE
jgi:hypothetical protein